MTMASPLLFLILVPLVAIAFILVGSNARATALIASVTNLVFVLALFAVYKPGEAPYQFVSSVPVVPSMGIAFTLGADGLSLVMLLLAALVTVAAVAVARTPEKNAHWFYASLLFISAGGIGAFASIDLFFFYMFHELALIPTFLLIGIWGSGDRQTAAWKATIYLALGSFVLLLGLIGLYLIQPEGMRTFDLRAIIGMAASGWQLGLSAAADRIRNPRLALSVPHMGAPSLCQCAGAGGHAPCRRPEKVRPLRPDPDRGPGASRRRRSIF